MFSAGGNQDEMNNTFDITPCGQYLLCGTKNGRIMVWNCDTSTVEAKIRKHTNLYSTEG